jgi:Tol biopolymer transport system component
MSLAPGARLGPYEILDAIGAGGMGEVYRARDTRLDRTVAIKVLPDHLSANVELRARFEREARAVSSLNHPNICTLHDVGHQDGVDFLVMEYVEGENLAARLERGPIPTDELLRISIQIADALDKAHRQGLIHRDLKPGNVMVTKQGAKLLDFGLARATGITASISSLTASPTMSSPLTAEGAIVGTFQYIAPEVLEGAEADARSDIFAFGAVLFEMATGKRAFEGKSRASVIAAILEREPPPISSFQPLIPPALERLVNQCMAKDPEARRQSMHDVLLELQWIRDGGSRAGIPAPVAARRQGRARLAGMVAGAAMLVGIAATTGYFARIPPKEETIRFQVPPPPGVVDEGSPRISPDGRQLAFNAIDSTGIPRIWIRSFDDVTTHVLAGTEGALRPFWSPDSRHIAFFTAGKLRKMAISGGAAQTLCERAGGADGSWSRQDVILFDGGSRDSITRVSAAGGPLAPATRLDRSRGEVGHAWPQFLPDGRHFLFLAFGSLGDSTAIKVGSIDSKDVKTIAVGAYSRIEYASPGYILFARDRALMAQPFSATSLRFTGDPFPVADDVFAEGGGPSNADFSLSQNRVLALRGGVTQGRSSLAWFDRSGKELGTFGRPDEYLSVSLSQDGNRALAGIGPSIPQSDIWVLERTRDVATRLTFDPASDLWPVWSPDGAWVAFGSNRTGGFALYRKRSDGVGDDELLLKTTEDTGPWDWSSDGRYIAYASNGGATRWDLWVLPTFGDLKPISFLKTQFGELEPSFSPDGRWIAYTSGESGQREIYVRPFPGPGGKWQVSDKGGQEPTWRRDGKELLYLSPEGDLMSVSVTAGVALEAGAPQRLFRAVRPEPTPSGHSYALSADGQRILVRRPAESFTIPATTVVLHWDAAIQDR